MPDSFKLHIKRWGWIVLSIIFFDQATKILADYYLNYHQPVSIIPMFNLTLVYNPGAAFSFLSDAGGWQRWFFIMLSSVISIVLFIWLLKLKPEQQLQTVSIAMILGGAIGNLIDRSIYGHVIDFLDVYYQQHHWPAFNIADSAITVGAILLIIDSFKNRHETQN
ncbi:MAG: signal peptidase II [Gammaproteobacteria bacterium]|nr:signal peptidase II [Gammaproteobacteria bacterium]MCW8909748.1 signal peptidase II [Gammaproteobacteria bacterium]MCW9006044.1 signal peptidase II [Gammaproteobacteria bacterium]MCW9055415.1 signal peptidase II [Gammaproteobacteria bacterium]